MLRFLKRIKVVFAAVVLLSIFSSYVFIDETEKQKVVLVAVLQNMLQYHYSAPEINDDFSSKVFCNLFEGYYSLSQIWSKCCEVLANQLIDQEKRHSSSFLIKILALHLTLAHQRCVEVLERCLDLFQNDL